MLGEQLIGWTYRNGLKPILFKLDAEKVHNQTTKLGEFLGSSPLTYYLTNLLFSYSYPALSQTIDDIIFPNPIGLAAGFDYDGHLAKVVKCVGFGFNTVGTVTAKPYEGNPGIRLDRLPKSKSLFVNKGFKSKGVVTVAKRLDGMKLDGHVIGISVGSSNLPEIDTVDKAIADYCFSFEYLKNKKYIRYFELNISCPNLALSGIFTKPENLEELLRAVKKIEIKRPTYLKMPNEISFELSDQLVKLALQYGISGFIFSNLVKDRSNPHLDRGELRKFAGLRGNFSGRPTYENSNELIKHTRKKFGRNFTIIGCGGVFSAADVQAKLTAGANLVQLITGMIFEGPQLVGEINEELVRLLNKQS